MAIVQFNPAGGHIYLVVKSGPPCMGAFRLWSRNKVTGTVSSLYRDEPNVIHDEFPDELVLPFSMVVLPDITLRIIGRYGPFPNKTQVTVEYRFFQDGNRLQVIPTADSRIRENLQTPPPYKQYQHDFTFEAY